MTRALAFLILLTLCSFSIHADQQRPNIMIIVADDLGWNDVSYHGSKIKTPHLDQLCSEGVRLNQHYVAPMCTPTRAGLLTGRYWSRFGNDKPSNERVLPWKTVTLADALKSMGYDTSISGKWHLGSHPDWGALKFGFNRSYGSLAGGVNPWSHLYKHGKYMKTWHRNDQLLKEEGHVTDLIAANVISEIKRQRNSPFFIYVPFTAPHTPFDEPKSWLESAKHIHSDRRQYAACVQHMDHAIGQFVKTLKETKQYDNTLILFFSDNGGTKGDDSQNYPKTKRTTKVNGDNRPLRGWKVQLYEGGIRVPAFITWKNKLKTNQLDTPISVTDWMPTLTKLIGFKSQKNLKWDGRDIFPLLMNPQLKTKKRLLYWRGVKQIQHAVRYGDWKLIQGRNGSKELFNLAEDPNEKNNVAHLHKEHIALLSKLLKQEKAKDNDALPNLKQISRSK